MNTNSSSTVDLEGLLKSLNKDYSGLSARIGALQHTVSCECSGVTLRLNFPTFRQRTPTIEDLIDCIVHYIMAFSLHRTQIKKVMSLKGTLSDDALLIEISKLKSEAIDLFIRAQKATDRNGEAGELILYLLTEWVLGAPQLLAKMSLKTNRQMPIHGADGVHVKFLKDKSTLAFYWGESKLHSDVSGAITSAVESIGKSLEHESIKSELTLVNRYIDFSDLQPEAKTQLLKYLDPFETVSNQRENITTCLVGFDFTGFEKVLPQSSGHNAEEAFKKLAEARLKELAPQIAEKLKAANLSNHAIELFFFPVPSVKTLRDLFQNKIGWTNDPGTVGKDLVKP